MDIQLTTAAGEVIVRSNDGSAVELREFYPHCAFTGYLADGEMRTFEDGCTAMRKSELVVWTEPLKG